MVHVLVMAKEPIPGRVKTRLTPPCSPAEAADLATAALVDVMAAATTCGADRVVLALDGQPGDWCPPGVHIVPQVSGSFDVRLAAAWDRAGGPGIQIGMDTPQVTAADLDRALATLTEPGTDATLGRAFDGGWWLIGLQRPDARVFTGLPMSCHDTADRQLDRLADLGLRCGVEPPRQDVDDMADAWAVAQLAPETHFARRLEAMSARWSLTGGAAR